MIGARTAAAWRRVGRPLWAALSIGLGAGTAHAACSVVGSGVYLPFDFNRIFVRPGATVGETLATRNATIQISCDRPTELKFDKHYPEQIEQNMWKLYESGFAARLTIDGVQIPPGTIASHPGGVKDYEAAVDVVYFDEPYMPGEWPDTTIGGFQEGTGTNIALLLLRGLRFTAGGCEIAGDSRIRNIDFGDVPQATFTGVGATGPRRDFEIMLKCHRPSPNVPMPVSVKFDGAAVAGRPDLLQVTGASAARGIGIQLTKADGSAIVLNEWRRWTDRVDRPEINLGLSGRYYQYAETVTPGDANGVLTFTVDTR